MGESASGRRRPGKPYLTWPVHLRGLVESFGAETVHRAGLKLLGYPPAWTEGRKECSGILEAIDEVKSKLKG